MNHLIRCCRGFAAALALTVLSAQNVPAAPRGVNAGNPVKSSLAARGWCVDDLCLDQSETALKPYTPRELAARPSKCLLPLRRYAVARTDGILEVTVDGTGRIAELERGYSDAVTVTQFEHMVKETSKKLSAHVVSRVAHAGATVVRLHNPSAHADMSLEYAPARALPLSVRLSGPVPSAGCEAGPLPSTN